MPTPSIPVMATLAGVQMAAEAVRLDEVVAGTLLFSDALIAGNNRNSKFPPALAKQFAAEWEVVDHRNDTGSGFSGTLFRCLVNDPLCTDWPWASLTCPP